MMKKLILLLIFALIVPLQVASGLEVIANQYDYGAYVSTGTISVVHPSSTTGDSAWGQSFRSRFDDCNLTVLQVVMWQSSATGGCTAYLIGETGTFGSSSLPTGSVLATSDEVTVTAGAAGTVYNFTFASGYLLDSAVDYCWYVAGTSGDVATEYIALDNAAPTSFDPSIGNAFYYDSSTWTAVSGSDVCFTIYGQDGTAASFNLGGDVTINEITETTNVTANVTAGDTYFNNTAVTAGDVTADGAVTVSGAITNNFNNTAVSASGDITAGVVTAGDVTATGNVTVAGGVTVDGSFDNATLTYTASAVSFDTDVWAIIFILMMVVLIIFPRVPLFNFLIGIVGVAFTGWLATNDTLWTTTPYLIVVLGFVSLFCILRGGFELRKGS